MSKRKIKIQPRFILRKYDKTIVPEILLKGKWLSEMGFLPGQEVKIELEENKLVITRLE
nr:SymE family type I addiction module toxin [uncultured Fluviicola sp.]